jgi:DNA-binding SARP family transcriptional activator
MDQLEPAYRDTLEQQDINGYLQLLSSDAVQWWFNLNIPRVAIHFVPLQEFPDALPQKPLRLIFISRLLTGEMTSESLAEFYRLFLQNNDPDAAILAVGAAYRQILDEGRDFSAFTQWQQRAEKLLQQEEISPLAAAFLLGLMGYATIVAEGNIISADALFVRQLEKIEISGSVSLRVYHAAMRIFLLLYRGDLSSAEIFLQDSLPLRGDTDCSLISRLYLQATHGFYRVLNGELKMAQQILDKTVNHPLFDRMSSSLWLLAQSHRLLAYAYSGDREQADSIAAQIRAWNVPQYNAFYHSYLHYSLGIAALIHREYRKGSIHAEEAALQAEKCQSHLLQMMPPMIKAQALAGMNKKEQALRIYEQGFQLWEQGGFNLVASTASLDVAAIRASQNRLEEARKYFQRAKDKLPEGEPLHLLYRSKKFLRQLELRLFETDDERTLKWEQYPIRIQTLGELRIEIGDHVIHDRHWRGGRTKLLLKLLIVHGGHNVSANHLADLLWPDVDGARGMQDLKVTLWRLRRLGLKKGEEPLPWLRLESGQLSLVRSLCIVDAVTFEQRMKSLLKSSRVDIDELIQALALYRGDFLSTDDSEMLIIEHRERLRQIFINGVVLLSEKVDSNELMEQTLDLLIQARELDPLNEKIHEHLMQLYLKLGFPAKALQSYQHAEEVLMLQLGIQPGPVLESLANSIRNEYHC